jgi:predicted lipoprotein with Yx(FWY)xxD motif
VRLHGVLGGMRLPLATATVVVAVAAIGVVANAKTSAPTVKASKNAAVGKTIVVDAKGRTLYRLQGDTTSHLLCTSTACVGAWPPLTVKSRSTKVRAGNGVNGKLAVFKRPDGKFQVTLRGLPLYRFSGDSAKGQAKGDGITAFGGTWHVVPANAGAAAAPTTTPAPMSPGSPY